MPTTSSFEVEISLTVSPAEWHEIALGIWQFGIFTMAHAHFSAEESMQQVQSFPNSEDKINPSSDDDCDSDENGFKKKLV